MTSVRDALLPTPAHVAKLEALCVTYGIASLEVFGSFARGEAGPDSDVDLLYQRIPGTRMGWEFCDLADQLEELFDRPVDLVSKKYLHELMRPHVLAEARQLYTAASAA